MKYEYRVINIPKYEEPSDLPRQLNELGEQGWKVIYGTTTYFLLMRELTPKVGWVKA